MPTLLRDVGMAHGQTGASEYGRRRRSQGRHPRRLTHKPRDTAGGRRRSRPSRARSVRDPLRGSRRQRRGRLRAGRGHGQDRRRGRPACRAAGSRTSRPVREASYPASANSKPSVVSRTPPAASSRGRSSFRRRASLAGIGAASDATAKLMQLGDAETVGMLDRDERRIRDVVPTSTTVVRPGRGSDPFEGAEDVSFSTESMPPCSAAARTPGNASGFVRVRRRLLES